MLLQGRLLHLTHLPLILLLLLEVRLVHGREHMMLLLPILVQVMLLHGWRLLLYKLLRRLPLPSPRTQARCLTPISKLSVIDRNPHFICVPLELDLDTTCI